MVLVDWINQFNDCMDRNNYPFDKIFSECDSQQVGGLSFTDFADMNEFVGVALAKKNLKKVFNIIDRDGSGRILLDEVRNISNLTLRPDETDSSLLPPAEELMETPEEDLKGRAILVRQQVNEIYEEIKNKLEHKSVTLEHVFYSHQAPEGKGGDQEPNVNAMQNVTKDGIIRNFARI